MLRALCRHFESRLFEVAMACAMLGLGAHLLMFPTALGASAFRFMTEAFSEGLVTSAFIMFGALRMGALWANGKWPIAGPWLRAGGCAVGALLWAQMDLALIALIPKVGTPPSPGIPVYFVLTLFEIVSIYRALARHGISGETGF